MASGPGEGGAGKAASCVVESAGSFWGNRLGSAEKRAGNQYHLASFGIPSKGRSRKTPVSPSLLFPSRGWVPPDSPRVLTASGAEAELQRAQGRWRRLP